jgi:hydrogenase nickel incorporation protein HypB
MFAAASIMLLNKIDLLPYLKFDVEKCLAYAREVNPSIEIFPGFRHQRRRYGWLDWLETQRCA